MANYRECLIRAKASLGYHWRKRMRRRIIGADLKSPDHCGKGF